MMKAIVVEELGSAQNMKYKEMDKPVISPKQVMIRVHTTSVNYADIKSRYGKKGARKLPFVPGLEASGIVEEIGDEVTAFRRGDRVLAFPPQGSYAEYVAADENLTFAVPDQVDLETAGACGIVSFLSCELLGEVARIQPGESVLVHAAAGGVGSTAIQVAKALGAGLVIGTVGSESKVKAALEAGADHVLCFERGKPLAEQVQQWTKGRGADIVLDSVGGELTQAGMDALAQYGRLVVFGNSSGEYGRIDTGNLHTSCRSVLGYSLGTTRKERPDSLRNTAALVFRLMETGKLQVHIGKRFPLNEAPLAHEWVESRKSTGKVILSL